VRAQTTDYIGWLSNYVVGGGGEEAAAAGGNGQADGVGDKELVLTAVLAGALGIAVVLAAHASWGYVRSAIVFFAGFEVCMVVHGTLVAPWIGGGGSLLLGALLRIASMVGARAFVESAFGDVAAPT